MTVAFIFVGGLVLLFLYLVLPDDVGDILQGFFRLLLVSLLFSTPFTMCWLLWEILQELRELPS